jgi:hypothetical protein
MPRSECFQIHGGKAEQVCSLLAMDARFRHAGITTKWRTKVLGYINKSFKCRGDFPLVLPHTQESVRRGDQSSCGVGKPRLSFESPSTKSAVRIEVEKIIRSH